MSMQEQIQKMKAENIKRLQEQQLKKIRDEEQRKAEARNNTPVTITGLKTNELPPLSGALTGHLFVLADDSTGYAYHATYDQVEASILAAVPPIPPVVDIPPASETQAGTVQLATDAEMQVTAQPATEDAHVASHLKIFNWWNWIKTQAQTIAAIWKFTAIQFTPTTTTGISGEMWLDNSTTEFKVFKTASETLVCTNSNSAFAGTTERILTAGLNGGLTPNYEVMEQISTDASIAAACYGGTYNSGNGFTSGISPAGGLILFKGQWLQGAPPNNYLYFAVGDNLVVRIPLG